MDSKWPFMLITFGLIFALGLTIASLERTTVMNNWDKRRCEIPVTMAAMFFKPASDPRTKAEFAKDNFDFCMKSYVESFMKLLMMPINALFGKHVAAAGSAVDMTNTIRTIATTLYNTLSSYLDTYYRKFNASVYEISRIIQYFRMAMRRVNGMMMSMLYSGITMFRGMLNTVQFIIKVILIICGIMLAIIIILIFVLFPFIPIIITVLGAIITTVLALAMVISGDVADIASNDKSGFCFSNHTLIVTVDKDSKKVPKLVSQIKIGDELANGCGKVTAVIEMDGNDVPLYYLNGILVSGSHLVKGEDGEWKSVAQDKRAIKTHIHSSTLYCFNTTTHTIPIYDTNTQIVLFRDWEEISDDDYEGQYEWNYIVLKMLNKLSHYESWKDSLHITTNIPLMSSKTKVYTHAGLRPLEDILMGRGYVLDSNRKKQKVLGIVRGEVEKVDESKTNGVWNTELYELVNGVWSKGKSTIEPGNDTIQGMTIITETGEFIIWDEKLQKERIIRDFTEVGYKTIHETYPFVASRLRAKE
jgi:hypothetical protein